MKPGCLGCSIFLIFCGFAGIVAWKFFRPDPPVEKCLLKLDSEPIKCATGCYSKDACAKVLQGAREATHLRRALRLELQHHLQLLEGNGPTAGGCQIGRPDWDLKYEKLKSAVNGTFGCKACKVRLPSDSATCAGLIKLFECAVSRIRMTYGSKMCLDFTRYEACNSIADYLIRESTELDHMYESVLPERKTYWDNIKSSMINMNQTLGSLRDSYKCPEGIICEANNAVVLNTENLSKLNEGGPDDVEYTLDPNDY